MQCGERVVGDLGFRGGHGGDQRRLAGGGIADECDIGDNLQFENDVALPPRCTEQSETGCFALVRRESRVAETALACLRHDEAHPRLDQVHELCAVGRADDRSYRNGEFAFFALKPVAVIAHPRPTAR